MANQHTPHHGQTSDNYRGSNSNSSSDQHSVAFKGANLAFQKTLLAAKTKPKPPVPHARANTGSNHGALVAATSAVGDRSPRSPRGTGGSVARSLAGNTAGGGKGRSPPRGSDDDDDTASVAGRRRHLSVQHSGASTSSKLGPARSAIDPKSPSFIAATLAASRTSSPAPSLSGGYGGSSSSVNLLQNQHQHQQHHGSGLQTPVRLRKRTSLGGSVVTAGSSPEDERSPGDGDEDEDSDVGVVSIPPTRNLVSMFEDKRCNGDPVKKRSPARKESSPIRVLSPVREVSGAGSPFASAAATGTTPSAASTTAAGVGGSGAGVGVGTVTGGAGWVVGPISPKLISPFPAPNLMSATPSPPPIKMRAVSTPVSIGGMDTPSKRRNLRSPSSQFSPEFAPPSGGVGSMKLRTISSQHQQRGLMTPAAMAVVDEGLGAKSPSPAEGRGGRGRLSMNQMSKPKPKPKAIVLQGGSRNLKPAIPPKMLALGGRTFSASSEDSFVSASSTQTPVVKTSIVTPPRADGGAVEVGGVGLASRRSISSERPPKPPPPMKSLPASTATLTAARTTPLITTAATTATMRNVRDGPASSSLPTTPRRAQPRPTLTPVYASNTPTGSTATLPLGSWADAMVASSLASARAHRSNSTATSQGNTPRAGSPVSTTPRSRMGGKCHSLSNSVRNLARQGTGGSIGSLSESLHRPHFHHGHRAHHLGKQHSGQHGQHGHRGEEGQQGHHTIPLTLRPHLTAEKERKEEKKAVRKRAKGSTKRHAHNEGGRKRWENRISEGERRRYEGVWASNRGVLSHYLPAYLPSSGTVSGGAVDGAAAVGGGAAGRSSASLGLTAETAEACDPGNCVVNVVVRDLWRRSRLPDDELAEVWELVDTQGRGMLGRREFVVGMWVVEQRLKGRKIPMRVQEVVWDSAGR